MTLSAHLYTTLFVYRIQNIMFYVLLDVPFIMQYDAMSESDSDLHTMRDYLQGLAKVKQKQLESVHRKRK